MADVLRSNEGLRVELAKSQKRVIELRDTLTAQQKIIADLQASLQAGKEDKEATADEESLSWFASLLRGGKPKKKKPSVQLSGCHSVYCCIELLSKWALEMGRFLLMGIWDFFWDPVAWWQGARESLQAFLRTQLQVVSRVVGILLSAVYINLIAWVLLRIRVVGVRIRDLWRGIWSLPVIALGATVVQWGLNRAISGRPAPGSDRTAQLLRKMEELTRLVREQQSRPAGVPQRPAPTAPAAAYGRMRGPCPNCGKTGHTLWECRTPKRCLKCRSTRHLAKDCPRGKAEGKLAAVSQTVFPPPMAEVADYTCEEDLTGRVEDLQREVEAAVGSAEGSRAPVLHVQAGIGPIRERVLVDTGSSVNVLPLSFAEGQGLELSTNSEETQMKLRAFNGTCSNIVGTALLPVTIGQRKATLPFVVTDASASIIIGMPGLCDLDFKVDPAQRRLEDRTGHLVFCQRADMMAPAYSLELSKN